MRLKGKIAVVTGGGSGIGRATALLFAEEGATVIVADWNEGAGDRTAVEIRQAGGQAAFLRTDVSQASEVEALVETTLKRFGRLDVLVNNAAIQIMSQLTETSEEVWDKIQSVNLKGVFLGCKYAIPAMVTSGGGSVINMASVLGFVGDPDLAAYCAAKGGVIALTKAAALGYGPAGVRVNCICPGDVETPLLQDYLSKSSNPAQLKAQIVSKYALRRVATPRDIADCAAFLASDASAFISGSTMVVDGGLTVKCY
jgi:NAD(P)-dependent dehydrogenase (short-subunit alcohol dehydrogenase family)